MSSKLKPVNEVGLPYLQESQRNEQVDNSVPNKQGLWP
jgi:hypothetical protein